MSERMYARFLLFMNAVDDDLLEEALAVRLAATGHPVDAHNRAAPHVSATN